MKSFSPFREDIFFNFDLVNTSKYRDVFLKGVYSDRQTDENK